MPIVKIKNSGYKSPDEMMRLINYVISGEKHQTDNLIGGTMILTGTRQYICSIIRQTDVLCGISLFLYLIMK